MSIDSVPVHSIAAEPGPDDWAGRCLGVNPGYGLDLAGGDRRGARLVRDRGAAVPGQWEGRLRFGSTGCGAAWLARLLWEQEAAGSNPAIPTKSAGHRVVARDQGAFQDRLTVI